MTRSLRYLVFASVLSLCASGRAAEPSTAECLEASGASLRYDNEHRLRAERTELLLCASRSCPADVRAECIRRVQDVNDAIPTILFEAKDAAGGELSEVRVAMDDELLAERLEGLPMEIDPGVHTFRFETAGQPVLEKQLVIRQAQKNRVELIRFPAGAEQADVESASARASARPVADARRSPQRKVAIFAGTVGVLGLGAGTAFGLIARSKRDLARESCPDLCPEQDGVERWRQAKLAGNLATAGFAVGGAAAAGAILLWILGKPESVTPSAQLGRNSAGVSVGGRW